MRRVLQRIYLQCVSNLLYMSTWSKLLQLELKQVSHLAFNLASEMNLIPLSYNYHKMKENGLSKRLCPKKIPMWKL